ncbi:hypothetical protein TSTA_114670 [Talaromyces stipitatus ATCC 10500]|uniref:Alpha-L-rhamnosidase C-terminal domain-containing protein n=1 Tax=Talaromyces stipitatus (strain ATCC 10500 / CBS 375.48 / QM 6759 / NRRL 1006) TaxID=441959 RepID=B8M998_TALSN|nr:uncharacterized protein TSTA_114670 [Talaromyces stipitatus ATCC 10500]EED17658.1 hypothetical protein TSTA_114670 [Talaromyces stipitatus ATCC 10500]
MYINIWALGPRTEQFTYFAPGTQSATWDISKNGTYIRGQKPASTGEIVNLRNCTVKFEAMIDYGGTGWRMGTEINATQATGPIYQTHYWRGYSTALLTEYALGVRPVTVGYREFLFAPLPGFKVERVQGRVPTPHDLIYANWGYGSNSKIIMDIDIPKGTKATVVPPFSGPWTRQG